MTKLVFFIIANNKGQCEKISEEFAKNYFSQIIGALEYCNEQKIVHRDLKPENILLTTDGVIKISGIFTLHSLKRFWIFGISFI